MKKGIVIALILSLLILLSSCIPENGDVRGGGESFTTSAALQIGTKGEENEKTSPTLSSTSTVEVDPTNSRKPDVQENDPTQSESVLTSSTSSSTEDDPTRESVTEGEPGVSDPEDAVSSVTTAEEANGGEPSGTTHGTATSGNGESDREPTGTTNGGTTTRESVESSREPQSPGGAIIFPKDEF